MVTSEAEQAEAIAEEQNTFLDMVGKGQIKRFAAICVGGAIVLLAWYFWPAFYPYGPYLTSPHFFTDVLRFWPLLIVAVVLNLTALIGGPALLKKRDEEMLFKNVITSLGAGVTEELWFRAVAPFFFMCGLIVMNELTAEVPVVVRMLSLLLMAGIAGAFLFPNAYRLSINPLAAIILFIASGIAFDTTFSYEGSNAFYDMVSLVFYPITDLVSFGRMQSVLDGPYPWLLVMGMFFANFRFRDGHIYQGVIGWVNAWWFGCVMIFATLNYGIWVAVAVHALFDTTVGVLQYLAQKGKAEPSNEPQLAIIQDEADEATT